METILVSDDVYTPGDKICNANSARSGNGTYVRDGFIYATLLGKVKLERQSQDTSLKSQNSTDASETSNLPVVSIDTQSDNTVIIPTIGSIVTAKIKSVNPRYAKCSIFAVNNNVVREHFRGQINLKDIRSTEKDKIEVYKSFRIGDIILARVISLGDSNSYLLSSAENELGVVIAYSEAGYIMKPISWNEMQCTTTLLKEHRKVAKVQSDFIKYESDNDHAEDEQSMDDAGAV